MVCSHGRWKLEAELEAPGAPVRCHRDVRVEGLEPIKPTWKTGEVCCHEDMFRAHALCQVTDVTATRTFKAPSGWRVGGAVPEHRQRLTHH